VSAVLRFSIVCPAAAAVEDTSIELAGLLLLPLAQLSGVLLRVCNLLALRLAAAATSLAFRDGLGALLDRREFAASFAFVASSLEGWYFLLSVLGRTTVCPADADKASSGLTLSSFLLCDIFFFASGVTVAGKAYLLNGHCL